MSKLKSALVFFVLSSFFYVPTIFASSEVRYVGQNSILCEARQDMDRALSAIQNNDSDRLMMMVATGRCFLAERNFEANFLREDGLLTYLELDIGIEQANFWTLTKFVSKP